MKTRKKSGFAKTKNIPLKKHPAIYRRTSKKGQIEYITTTHHEIVEINGKNIPTRKLNKNIDTEDHEDGYVLFRVYKGLRSSLGKEVTSYKIDPEDVSKIDSIFKDAPREYIHYTSNSKNKKNVHKKKKST